MLHKPEHQRTPIFLRALVTEHLQLLNDTASSSLPANEATRQAQWSNIVGGVPNITYEGHHQ